MRLLNTCLSLMILGTTLLPALAQTHSKRNATNNISLKICGESDNWVRPTAAEQKTHLTSLNRYSSEQIKELGGAYWNYSIFAFITYPGGSGTYDITQLSGLWTPQNARHPDDCSNYVKELNAGKIGRVWTLNYKVVSLQWLNNLYVMKVRQVHKGAQVIQFRRQESLSSLPLTVIDEGGKNIPVLFH